MPQFDVHRLARSSGLVVDCQSDLLSHIDSRFVVPLVRRGEAPPPARRLNPSFTIEGEEYVMLTQTAAAVRRSELGPVVGSMAHRSLDITSAIDVLIGGV
ncbi:MAG: CcdB family protein [Novosphingobium sp.]|nr:CcdB family protein [Novosphingobium sp.]